MKNAILWAALLALTATACKKDDPESALPAATQDGRNTGGCLINGKAFVAKTYGGTLVSSPIPAIEYGFAFDSLYYLILNGQFQGQGTSVTLFLRRPKPGMFLLNQNTQYVPQTTTRYALNHATYSVRDNSNEVYVTNAQHTGEVVLTKANDNPSVLLSAGTFSFTAVSNQDPTKTITITNGRFDRKQ